MQEALRVLSVAAALLLGIAFVLLVLLASMRGSK